MESKAKRILVAFLSILLVMVVADLAQKIVDYYRSPTNQVNTVRTINNNNSISSTTLKTGSYEKGLYKSKFYLFVNRYANDSGWHRMDTLIDLYRPSLKIDPQFDDTMFISMADTNHQLNIHIPEDVEIVIDSNFAADRIILFRIWTDTSGPSLGEKPEFRYDLPHRHIGRGKAGK